MAECIRLEVNTGNFNAALKEFFSRLLEKNVVDALLLPIRQPDGVMVMSTLVKEPQNIDGLDPLAPVTPVSVARIVSSLTYKTPEYKIAVFMRPCDYRAYVELVKLNQASRESLLVIGTDCIGRLSTRDFLTLVDKYGETGTLEFIKNSGKLDGLSLHSACNVCEFPSYKGPDIQLQFIGGDIEKELILVAETEEGKEALSKIELEEGTPIEGHEKAIETIASERKANRDAMFKEYSEAISSFSALRDIMKTCINCYNCRVACPVCYCKECVFVTDTFRHEPDQYLRWAEKRGQVKLPTDTVFYHITRMLHMSLLCVGCGQCSSACPMELPVMEIFRTIANKTQPVFEYEPGQNIDEPIPLAAFKEDEFQEIGGE